MGENKLKGMICLEFQSVDVQIQCDYDFLRAIRTKTSCNTALINQHGNLPNLQDLVSKFKEGRSFLSPV